jgi:hypothetical protein
MTIARTLAVILVGYLVLAVLLALVLLVRWA